MNQTKTFDYPEPGPHTRQKIRVWDPLVRIFHWSLAGSFLIAYLTEDDFLGAHVWAGYTIMALVMIRLIWGFIGTPYARWSDFIKPPAQVKAYLKKAIQFKADRYIGHNPAGGAMVFALILSLIATTVTGLAVYGAQELSGPLAAMLSSLPEGAGHLLEETHETFANLSLLLVILHLVGVAFASLQHRENLVRAMITGYKNTQDK